MKLNLNIDKTLHAQVRGRFYPVTVAGKGFPCLSIGLGTIMQRTVSNQFKNIFEVYSSDLYWHKDFALENPYALTMDNILDDLKELGESLKLSNYFLLGHSAWGIIALEFAKKYPSLLAGIIMVGSPTESSPRIAALNNAYFEKHAEPERKKIDVERRRQWAQEDLAHLDVSARFLREYIWRDGPRYWHDPEFDCTALWQDIEIDETLAHLFANILPSNDIEKGLHEIRCPIFLAAGESDYDCCPHILWPQIKNLPRRMEISFFKQSGHYPNYEESELFDQRVTEWVKANFSL